MKFGKIISKIKSIALSKVKKLRVTPSKKLNTDRIQKMFSTSQHPSAVSTQNDEIKNRNLFTEAPEKYQLLGREELRKLPPVEWLVKHVLPAKGIALIYGASGSGKSFVSFDLACAIAEGADWFDIKVRKTPVVYIALEGQMGFRTRIDAWEQHHEKELPENYKMILQDFKLTSPAQMMSLNDVIPRGATVIIDTMNRTAPMFDENNAKDMGLLIESAKHFQKLCNGLVIIVHHAGKVIAAGPRGHSSLFDNCDAVINVTRNGNERKWSLSKSKEGMDGQTFSFELDEKLLGIDEDGDQVSSCVIKHATGEISSRNKERLPQGANQKTAYKAIKDLLAKGADSEPDQGIQLSVAVASVANLLDVPHDRKFERAKAAVEGLLEKTFLVCENDILFMP